MKLTLSIRDLDRIKNSLVGQLYERNKTLERQERRQGVKDKEDQEYVDYVKREIAKIEEIRTKIEGAAEAARTFVAIAIDLRPPGVISTTHVQIAASPYKLELTIAELEEISHAVLRHLNELSSRLHRSKSEVIAQINKRDHDEMQETARMICNFVEELRGAPILDIEIEDRKQRA